MNSVSTSEVHSHVLPDANILLRLPNGLLKHFQVAPDSVIDTGKYGAFPANLLLGRPYYYTYQLDDNTLRIVTPAELNAEQALLDTEESGGGDSTEVAVGIDTTKNNRLTIDDASRQGLSQQEIEELKKTVGGQELIDRLLESHAGLDEKTAFSRAKYMLRKTKKYLKRFEVLPVDMGSLIEYIIEKEPARIMELRMETLGLVTAWSNAHFTDLSEVEHDSEGQRVGGGRWLVVDETGGLLVAALAERMGILYPQIREHATDDADIQMQDADTPKSVVHMDYPSPATTNSITLVHPAIQPNISLLKYFGYDASSPATSHPLHTRVKPLSWLQLLDPTADATYNEPETLPQDVIRALKPARRSMYYKKRRRWTRCKAIVDEAREGGFDGLVVASHMEPAAVMRHLVPLIRGGGTIVVYAATVEPLAMLVDLYSKERRTSYIETLQRGEEPSLEDFPVDPRLLLPPTIHTTRQRTWQALPGRTHPLMGSRGGSEGYVFVSRRVVPVEDGGVQAKGQGLRRGRGRKPDTVAAE